MTSVLHVLIGGVFALSLAGPVLAGDTPATLDATAIAHEKSMRETVCRTEEDEETGHHVRHRTCKTRAEWLAIDKAQKGQSYDPDNGRVVVKE
jgi:hypothetical protein